MLLYYTGISVFSFTEKELILLNTSLSAYLIECFFELHGIGLGTY